VTTGSPGPPAYRYLKEVIAVLANEAPDLHEALERARDEGLSHVILDGTIIPADRCRAKTLSIRGEAIDLWYSGKAHCHGGNIQAVIAPGGFPLWVSDAEPGSLHDITAARIHALPALVLRGRARAARPGRSRIPWRRHRHLHSRQRAVPSQRLPGAMVSGAPAVL
jgi:hypothetical protein